MGMHNARRMPGSGTRGRMCAGPRCGVRSVLWKQQETFCLNFGRVMVVMVREWGPGGEGTSWVLMDCNFNSPKVINFSCLGTILDPAARASNVLNDGDRSHADALRSGGGCRRRPHAHSLNWSPVAGHRRRARAQPPRAQPALSQSSYTHSPHSLSAASIAATPTPRSSISPLASIGTTLSAFTAFTAFTATSASCSASAAATLQALFHGRGDCECGMDRSPHSDRCRLLARVGIQDQQAVCQARGSLLGSGARQGDAP